MLRLDPEDERWVKAHTALTVALGLALVAAVVINTFQGSF